VSYKFAGKELLPQVPMPNFWRAPVDNDKGSLFWKRAAQWKIASLYASGKKELAFEDDYPAVKEEEGSVSVSFRYYLPTKPEQECEVTYRVFGDGTVETKLSMDLDKEAGELPEFGMQFRLDADYDRIEWYGRGPEETYADRKRGGKFGIYEENVKDALAGYLKPQECGNKTDVRWAKIKDRKGRGMMFFGKDLNVSALPYTCHELENALHVYELPKPHYTVVRVALAQIGVGGDDSWGSRPHPEYRLPEEGHLDFTFCFRGI
jgi:beta-galactosidase